MDKRSTAADRQGLIYGTSAPASSEPIASAIAARSIRQRGPVWQNVAAISGAVGMAFSVVFGAWTMFGHLVLPEAYTYATVFGTRQGLTTGAAWAAGANGQIEAQNIIARGTAKAEGERQAILIRETTAAQAAQQARVQAESLSATARLQASASCYSQVLSYAQTVKAQCIGSGVAGGECEARADVITEQLAACGSLDVSPSISKAKEPANDRP